MKKEINQEIVSTIRAILKDSDRDHPITRDIILSACKCSDRELRWTYSKMPEVGELGNGLFLKRTALDWKHHRAKLKKIVKSTMDRIRESEKAEQDLHQYNLKWLHHQFILKGECPKFLLKDKKI